ncbi:MAG: hypothetical protein ACI4JS_10925 [Oscillospiraceae bacterium]
MINPLIITRNENAGLFRRICGEIGASQRELIGDEWSLALFLKRDLKNYNYQSHYVLDVSAFKEKGDDFVSLVEGILYQNDKANVVIYADGYFAGDGFLDKLVHSGITNIVANYSDLKDKDNFNAMAEDLKECLTSGLPREKWRRYDNSFDAFAQAREAAEIAEKELSKPRYAKSSIHIAVVGSQTRIGTTTFSLRLAEYFRSRDAESVVVCAAKRGVPQLEMIYEMFGGTEQDGIYTIGEGVDICSADAEPKKSYNAEIYDFGNTPTSGLDLNDFDKVYVVGGTSWNELPMIYAAQLPLNKVNYTVAVNFSGSAELDKYREALSVNLNDVISLPFEVNPFSIDHYEKIFDDEFDEWADENEEEDTAEK